MQYTESKPHRIFRKLSLACGAMERAKTAYFQATKQSDNFEVWETYRNHWHASVLFFVGWGRALGRMSLSENEDIHEKTKNMQPLPEYRPQFQNMPKSSTKNPQRPPDTPRPIQISYEAC